MANYDSLKATIQSVVKQNGNNEITGQLLQQALLSMINSLGAGYQFMGIATPSTNPGTPDYNVFYIATQPGTYSNFNGLVVGNQDFAIFKYNGSWSKEVANVATLSTVNELEQKINGRVFVNCPTATFANRFFKELFIEPVVNTFDVSSIKKISIYRNVGVNTLWNITFYDENGERLAEFATNTNPESTDIIVLNPVNTNNRFGARALVDWSQIANSTSIYQYGCSVSIMATNKIYSPYIYIHDEIYTKGETINAVAKNVLFKFEDIPFDFLSLSSGATLSGNVLTISSGSTTISYIGTKTINIFNNVTKYIGKWITLCFKAKITSGNIDDINIGDIGIYPASIERKNISKKIIGNYINYSLDVKFLSNSDTSGQIYVSYLAKSGASASVSILLDEFYYHISEETDEDITNFEKLLTEVIDAKVREVKTKHIYCSSASGTNDATHYYGLMSITDALNDIKDNDFYNRYVIHISGQYYFNNVNQLTMPGVGNEFSVIEAKPYVSFEGEGTDRTVLFVDLPSSVGSNYQYYQPIYVECPGEVSFSNMSVIGRNCRYTIHLEIERYGSGAIRNFKNMRVIHLGLNGISSLGFEHAFGCGMGTDHIWNIEDCYMESTTGDFRLHNNLHDSIHQGTINFKNCTFGNTGVGVDTYSCLSDMYINLVGCSFAPQATISNASRQYGNHKLAQSSKTLISSSNPALVYDASMDQCKVIRIDATDETQNVSFDVSSSAFNIIIGDDQLESEYFTQDAVNTKYGYFFRKGFAYGSIDVDSQNGNRSIGKLLGDCTTTNKVLRVTIGESTYVVTFNQNYTNISNDDIISAINTVLGENGVASLFSINREYYPQFDGLIFRKNTDSEKIMAGMCVVLTASGMRRAKSTDGYISGICLDTIQPNEIARVMTKGRIFSSARSGRRFHTLDTGGVGVGTALGVSSAQDGYLDKDATPKVCSGYVNDSILIG